MAVAELPNLEGAPPGPGDTAPGRIVDSDHAEVAAFATEVTGLAAAGPGDAPAAGAAARDAAVALFDAVRDRIRYNPYKLDPSGEGFKASATLAGGESWCVPKAVLLAAAARAVGIPARVGFADVRNHLSTRRLRERMGTDVFHWHGYTALYLDGAWRKATPAFNTELCTKFGLKPLVFDGVADALYHSYDLAGNRHMEYLRYRGEYTDVPLDRILATFAEVYGGGGLGSQGGAAVASGDWDADVAAETGTD